ncbi:MAG: fasciclin domain-containing protein [Pseudomonadota bacterium]
MLRRSFFATTAFAALFATSAFAMGEKQDIVDIAAGAGTFSTLVAAVEAADLVDTLKSEGPFTVFAPTDEAFAKLPEGTVETLLLPENKSDLIAVLTYHVIPGAVMSTDIAGQMVSPTTVQGSMLDIDATDGVMVDGASVIQADITASNGVIHVIDSVILPN